MLMVNQLVGFNVGGGTFATLDSTRTSGTAPTLSNGNLRATGTTAASGRVASTIAAVSPVYFEFKRIDANGVGNFIAVGVQNSAQALSTGQYSGNPTSTGGDANEWMLVDRAQACNHPTYGAAILSTIGQNDVVMCAVNPTTGEIWFGRNGTWSGDPAAGTGEAFTNVPTSVYVLVYLFSTCVVDVNFGASAFAHTRPAGFGLLTT